jgi:hypothetical protein
VDRIKLVHSFGFGSEALHEVLDQSGNQGFYRFKQPLTKCVRKEDVIIPVVHHDRFGVLCKVQESVQCLQIKAAGIDKFVANRNTARPLDVCKPFFFFCPFEDLHGPATRNGRPAFAAVEFLHIKGTMATCLLSKNFSSPLQKDTDNPWLSFAV